MTAMVIFGGEFNGDGGRAAKMISLAYIIYIIHVDANSIFLAGALCEFRSHEHEIIVVCLFSVFLTLTKQRFVNSCYCRRYVYTPRSPFQTGQTMFFFTSCTFHTRDMSFQVVYDRRQHRAPTAILLRLEEIVITVDDVVFITWDHGAYIGTEFFHWEFRNEKTKGGNVRLQVKKRAPSGNALCE